MFVVVGAQFVQLLQPIIAIKPVVIAQFFLVQFLKPGVIVLFLLLFRVFFIESRLLVLVLLILGILVIEPWSFV